MKFLPQNDTFFDLLEQLSGHMVTVAEQLRQMPRPSAERAALLERIRDEEQTADELTLRELKNLDAAFITPIDREDIMRLMSALYAVVESMTDLAFALDTYRLGEQAGTPSEELDTLHALVGGTGDLVQRLRAGHKLADMEDTFRSFRKLKREADQSRREGVRQILGEDAPDPLRALQIMDQDRLLRAVVDRCDTVRAALQEVVLKNS